MKPVKFTKIFPLPVSVFPLFTPFLVQSSSSSSSSPLLSLFLSHNPHSSFSHTYFHRFPSSTAIVTGFTSLFKRKPKMSEFSFSNSSKASKIPSLFLLSHLLVNLFFFIFLSPYPLMLLCSFTPLFFTTFFLLALFPPNPDHGNGDDDSPSSDSRLGFLLSVVQSLVRKISSKNDENAEGIRFFEEFQAYLDVFRAPELFEVLDGNCSESGFSGEEEGGREESRAHHVGPMENKPNGNFDQSPFGKEDDDGGKVEAARPIAEENNKFCEKECNGVLEENLSYSGNDGRESRNLVGAKKKERSVDFDENPFEKDKGKLEGNEFGEENLSESVCSGEQDGRSSPVDLIQDPNVINLEGKPAGEEDDVDKVEKNTKLEDMFCQKRDKEVKPLDTDPNKAQENKDKMTLGNGSKVMCNDSIIDAEDNTAEEEEEYFWTPGRYWEYNNTRSYGSMRKEKEWRRTLAFKFYEERNNVDDDDDGRSSTSKSEVMDLLWETYEDTEHDKVKGSTESKANEEEDEEEEEEVEEEEEEEKEKGMKSKYCCLQALKFSSGKVNLGMRKPSLVKISKALKSFGFLHHVSKHGRKKIN